ncbi:hypothetical protein FRC04_006130 [Tulasnella sp. 424]|nr:hypothetical protein FRC04_006130 [Tulasnella sp. 424]
MPATTSSSAPFQPPVQTTTPKTKERAELVRRTRKLKQVLGVAMHVVEAGKSIGEAAVAVSSLSAGAGAGVPDHIEIPERVFEFRALQPGSSSPVTGQTHITGALVSTSTQVHVDEPSETTTTPEVESPPSKESTLPWYCSPVDMNDNQDE